MTLKEIMCMFTGYVVGATICG